jgi:ubiquitin carboxyl-terminal hydrolase L5
MEVEIGNELQNFKEFASGLGPELCGDAIGSNELIRRAHNSFARPELIAYAPEDGNRSRGGTEDPFHFVSILPVGDTLYEFDGLKPAPISHGQFLGSWTTLALRAIQEKIIATQSAGQGEIRFNLMAVIKDRSAHYRGLIDQQIRLICQLEESLCTHPPIEGDDNDLRNRQIADLIAQNAEWEAKLESEQLKAAQYQRENARRRHNCVPLAVALLRHMASEGLLP